MATRTKRTVATGTLPVVTVARLEVSTALLDAITAQETRRFAERGQDYKNAWSERSERPLRHDEVAQVAAALGAALGVEDVPALLSQVQASDLKTRSDPPRSEVLLSAGLATAPAFISACLEFAALIEMSAERFEESFDAGTVRQDLRDDLAVLRKLPLMEARQRVQAAFLHIAEQSGSSPGEVIGLILRVLGTALQDAIGPLSQFGSLTGSLVPTGGPDASAYTDSPGGTSPT